VKTCLLLFAAHLAAAANLTVANVWDHSPVIVYELPNSDGRADAIRYIESVRDRSKQNVKVLDAAAMNPAALKNGFILYTTLGDQSHLLRLATRRLNWMFTPTPDLRYILVGRNPYSKGYCAVFVAGSNRDLVGINDVENGAASYHVYQGDQLLREGAYDQTFVSVDRLSKAAALEDVNQFFATLKRVHPDLLGKLPPDSYLKLKQQTVDAVGAKAEIPVDELASLLYYAGAYFHDGHTSVRWGTHLNPVNTRGKRFPAFRLAFDNGRFLIAAAKDPSMVDAELVSVNGTPALDFLRPILDRTSGETLGYRVSCFHSDEPFWYYLTNLFGSDTPYLLKLRDPQGREREVPLETLPFPEYLAFYRDHDLFRPNHQGIKVEFFDSDATAHFLYPSFHASPEEKKKIAEAFAEIKAKGSRNLILDIRNNGGGLNTMAEYLFRYIYAEKFRSVGGLRFKASWDILPLLPIWFKPVDFVFRGHVLPLPLPPPTRRKPDAFFSGRTFLLVDNGSFSMASRFATMFRDYKAGTILGYETGGMPITFGGPYGFTLKHSRIPCVVAWTQILPPMSWPGDSEHGVIPDVPLNARNLADFKSEQDPALAFTLRYISLR
jgi:hypothetical protein